MSDSGAPPVSAVEPDWSREVCGRFEWKPGAQLVRSVRQYQAVRKRPGLIRLLLKPWAVWRYRFWSAVSGADVPLNAQLGGGLVLLHPNGVVIHARATVGVNCLILQQVTLGTDRSGGVPKIGGHVDIGAGAKILGNVTIGDHAAVGANAVVLCDVPEGCTAVGVPARILRPAPRGATPP